ncbi:MAG: lysylphosphatidylglycerol synthase transmembrane domain-containing protein [Candidatus Glassbacteria bacterium]
MKRLITPLKILVTVGILYLIFKKFQIDWKDITEALSNSSPLWWLASIGTQFLAILFSIQRWKVLLVGQRLEVPFGHLASTYMVGRFLGTFTPTGVGLEAYKAYDIARYTSKATESVAVVFIEKTVVTFLSLSFLVIVSLFFIDLAPTFLYAFFAFFTVLLLLAIVLLFQPALIEKILLINFPGRAKVEGILRNAVESFTMYSKNRSPLAVALIFGILVYLSLFSTFYTNSKALRVPEPTTGTIERVVIDEGAREKLREDWIEFVEAEGEAGDRKVAEVLLTENEKESLAESGITFLEEGERSRARKGISLKDVYIVGPLTQIATMIPLSIAGIGLREGAFAGLLESLGIWIGPKTVLTSVMWYFVSISINIIGAVLFLVRKTDYEKTISEMKQNR